MRPLGRGPAAQEANTGCKTEKLGTLESTWTARVHLGSTDDWLSLAGRGLVSVAYTNGLDEV